MSKVPQISAQMLREGRHTIAERICARLDSSLARSNSEAPSSSFAKRIELAEMHVHILAACIEFSSPALLDDYVRWIAHLPERVSPFVCDISRFLKELLSHVETQFPGEVSLLIKNYIDRALESLLNASGNESFALSQNPDESLQRDYLESLLAKRQDEALRLALEAVDAGIDIESIYLNVIQPTQQEIGRLWQAGEIDVAQEHYCTAATQFVMSQLQPYFMSRNSTGKTLVAACVGDELHEVGLRIVADLFEISGWNTIYLGANVPAASIAHTIVSSGAQVLAISTTMTQHLFGLVEVIRAVRSHPSCGQVKVLVGGYPFNVDPFLWKRVGADADALDGKEAVCVANRLIESEGKSLVSVAPSPALLLVEETVPPVLGDSDDDLSRLNNNLITLQRKLNKANVELAALNKANQEKAEALQRADRRKDQFLAMLAHELRGPLAPMELAVALLQMDDLKPSVVEEARGTMKRQLQQMTHLISDLLDASRIAHGKIELKLDLLELTNVIHRAVEIVHPLIQGKLQELKLDLLDVPVVIQGDEIRLAQVFANLLTNASKYTDRRGRIWLTTKRVRDMVVVEVKDNGVGIEAQLLPDVFSTFAQEQRSRQHSMGGLGLGLSLVKQLVELHDGTVAAESAGAGLGSIFTVTLPSVESEATHDSFESDTTEDSAGLAPSRRVLIVEDTAGIARITAILFEKLGHVPEIALDGATAIQKVKQSRPQIVVLDLELPDMSGLDVTREIRRLDPDNLMLVVALTGHGDDEHRRLAKDSGCDVYLVKPVDVRDLKELATHTKLMATNGSH